MFIYPTAPPNITDPTGPTTETVDEGQSVTLTCIAASAPAVMFMWRTGDGTSLMNMGRVSISQSPDPQDDFIYVTGTLTINQVDESDAGDYRCVASNDIGDPDEETFTLIVNCESITGCKLIIFVLVNHTRFSPFPDEPRIITSPGNVEAEYRDNVTLSCVAEGLPPPNITWFMQPSGGSPSELMDDANTTIETEMVDAGANSTLTLYNVQPSDTASYTCRATNDLGMAEGTAFVNVLGMRY